MFDSTIVNDYLSKATYEEVEEIMKLSFTEVLYLALRCKREVLNNE